MEFLNPQQPYDFLRSLYKEYGVPDREDEKAREAKIRFLSERLHPFPFDAKPTLQDLEAEVLRENGFDSL
jgi:hypothetical protein